VELSRVGEAHGTADGDRVGVVDDHHLGGGVLGGAAERAGGDREVAERQSAGEHAEDAQVAAAGDQRVGGQPRHALGDEVGVGRSGAAGAGHRRRPLTAGSAGVAHVWATTAVAA